MCLIYLEKGINGGDVEIRESNWKPLLFITILLSSKFQEEIRLVFSEIHQSVGESVCVSV
eukprot:403348730